MRSPKEIIQAIAKEEGLLDVRRGGRVLITLSGGLDSTVLLYLVRHLGFEAVGIEFKYRARPTAEVEALQDICRHTNTRLVTIPYPAMSNEAGAEYFANELVESNGLYYVIASNFAFINGFPLVFSGVIRSDWEDPRGQNSPYLFQRINELLRIEFGEACPRIVTPLISLSKKEVVSLGRFLQVPMETTWSCVEDGPHPCGSCANCEGREEALHSDQLKREPLAGDSLF